MPRSMTGYGAARATGSRVAVEIEARSVNARSLKVSLRSPSLLTAHEPELERLIRDRVHRGTLTLFVRLELLRPEDTVRVRPGIVEGFARSLAELRKKGLITGELSADAIASIPGAIDSTPDQPLRPVDWRVVKTAAIEALDAMNAMRQREAGHLVADLARIVRRMRKTLAGITRRSPRVVKEHQKKLRDRLDLLLASVDIHIDEAILAREIAVLADRSDITEEITRLNAHLDEFEGYLDDDGGVGRTLDFLCQEILREVNTIGSKSGDVAITRAVISLKSEVDRLKEQVANLE